MCTKINFSWPHSLNGKGMVTWTNWDLFGGRKGNRCWRGKKKNHSELFQVGFWSLVKESFGQSASWSVAKCLCLDPLQPDSNFLLHSVDAAIANTSHHWLIILASWHLTLLQAPLMELKIPLAELILACSNLKSLALLCMEAAEICAHKGRESKFFWGKPIFNKSWT